MLRRTVEEPLIFERSAPGKEGYPVPEPAVGAETGLPPELVREDLPGFPEVSEFDVMQHFFRLSHLNYCIEDGLFPLGSCTMKYNPKVNEVVAATPGLAQSHPYLPDRAAQGIRRVLFTLERILCEITGLDAVTLQPAAGAHGEQTGIMLIKACQQARGEDRPVVLIPDSAHGTNPSSAHICNLKVETIGHTEGGGIDVAELKERIGPDVAALMLTNPSTLGVFEERIAEIAEALHAKGAMLYLDGANLNAFVGKASPARMGVDVLHMNLHKTFSTPHGGGGPGAGPVAVCRDLEPFLPVPRLEERDGLLRFTGERPQSIGRVRAFYGNVGMLIRATAYILANGPEGLREMAEVAVLNANYLRRKLEDVFHLPYDSPSLHEVVFSHKRQKAHGVTALDIAKRLMDYGFYPPTIYFPLIVDGALMIEPTETASREELDQFIEAMRAIARETETDPELVKTAPHHAPLKRLDATRANRHPVLRWTPPPE